MVLASGLQFRCRITHGTGYMVEAVPACPKWTISEGIETGGHGAIHVRRDLVKQPGEVEGVNR